MKIYINARFLTRSISGVERYATELVRAIDSLIESGEIDTSQITFELIAPKNIAYELNLKHIPLRKVGYLNGHLWEQIELPFYSHNGLLLSLCMVSTLFKRNQIVTIHDAAFAANSQTFTRTFSIWYKIVSISLGKIAIKIITVSNFSKLELQKYCNILDKKLTVIYEGKEHILRIKVDENILKKNDLSPRSFVLAVSNITPNKNFNSIIKAINLLGEVDFDIVIAGGTRPQAFRQIEKLSSKRIKYVGYVSDEELKALYKYAICFVYPSFYEGFGLPPLEAMTCGCPVIVSNTSALPEIFGDAALYCNPYSSEDIASKIQQLANNIDLQSSLKQKCLERAQQFSWEKCARETVSVIRNVL